MGVIVVGVVALVALVIAVLLAFRTNRMKSQYAVLSAADGRASFVEVVARKAEEVEGLRDDVALLADELRSTQRELQMAVRHVGVVRHLHPARDALRHGRTERDRDQHQQGVLQIITQWAPTRTDRLAGC